MNYAEQMLGVRGNLNCLICNSVFSASKLRQLFGCVLEYFHNKVALARAAGAHIDCPSQSLLHYKVKASR